MNYCSSDGWQGLGTETAVNPHRFPRVPFDREHAPLSLLHFSGARIVDAVIATIMRGEVRDEFGNPRPDLIPTGPDAELVMAGSSAGGFGTIRNLDSVAREIREGLPGEFAAAPEVTVWGIPDAATSVGVLPVTSGQGGYDAAYFYTDGNPAMVRTDDDCDPAGTTRCFDAGGTIIEHWIATPVLVVQQAFAMVIHKGLKAQIAKALRVGSTRFISQYPRLPEWVTKTFGSPEEAAEAYIRFRVTTSAPGIGRDLDNPAGLYIPNYETGWHQLMTNSERFYTSPTEQRSGHDPHGDAYPGDPRLGPIYAGTTVSISTAIDNFRRCVRGDFGLEPDFQSCVRRMRIVDDVEDNARVINTTAIPAGLMHP